jgi:hypothetical protein
MDVFGLAERLRDPDPRVRVETLRILAMVEETRALAAVAWVYRHDPEPGVREVANWAGRLIHAAQQRGYSTQKAIEEMFTAASPDREGAFLEQLEAGLSSIGDGQHRATRRFAAEQEYQRQLDAAMRPPVDAAEQDDDVVQALPPVVTGDASVDDGDDAASESVVSEQSDTGTDSFEADLLDAGLTDLFAE